MAIGCWWDAGLEVLEPIVERMKVGIVWGNEDVAFVDG